MRDIDLFQLAEAIGTINVGRPSAGAFSDTGRSRKWQLRCLEGLDYHPSEYSKITALARV
jgi:hypothetical protein